MSEKNMREIDTETPVVWPAWCYSGEASIEDSSAHVVNSQFTASASLPTSTTSSKNKEKRKALFANSMTASITSAVPTLDKMLSDRMLNLTDNNKFSDNNTTNSNLFYNNNESKTNKHCDITMNLIKNGQNSDSDNNMTTTINNNNNIKCERLSPQQNVDNLNSRSRSATPSSYPETPPQSLHNNNINTNINDIVHQQPNTLGRNNSLGPMKQPPSEFAPRNYSDFIRSLAAKYNNNNSNESNNSKNNFFDSRFVQHNSGKFTKDSPSPPDCKRLQLTTISNQNNVLMSSILPSISFPSSVFSPLIDMSSTQALVTLARAAKEAELKNLLKGPTPAAAGKRPNIKIIPAQNSFDQNQNLQRFSTSSSTIATTTPHITSTSRCSPNNISSTIQNNSNTNNSNSNNNKKEQISSPLDLSSSTPISKRLKLDSSSPNRSLVSNCFGKTGDTSNYGASSPPTSNHHQHRSSLCGRTTTINQHRKCQSQSDEVNSWTVSQVCDFVNSIDICAEYVANFREQCIDGTGLTLLTEDHLMNSLSMKLGPALKLRSVLAKKIGGPCPCVSCALTSITAPSPSGSIPRPSSVDSGT